MHIIGFTSRRGSCRPEKKTSRPEIITLNPDVDTFLRFESTGTSEKGALISQNGGRCSISLFPTASSAPVFPGKISLDRQKQPPYTSKYPKQYLIQPIANIQEYTVVYDAPRPQVWLPGKVLLCPFLSTGRQGPRPSRQQQDGAYGARSGLTKKRRYYK